MYEHYWDVWCPNPGCEHGHKKWRILGHGADVYQCAKCGSSMRIELAVLEPAR